MDKRDCLKSLTENIVKKQNDSLESINKLRRSTEIVRSDISNLINSLLMVGNRQFAENKILDDDLIAAGGEGGGQTNSSSTSNNNNSQQQLKVCQEGVEEDDALTLSSILLRAFECLPQDEDKREHENESVYVDVNLVESQNEPQHEMENENKNGNESEYKVGHGDEKEIDYEDSEIEVGIEVGKEDRNEVDHVVKPAPPLDRNRVADILKRYSLYDDDEDDDDDDDNDSE